MKNLKYYLLLLLTIAVCISCSLVDNIYWHSYPGSLKDGHCEEYAKAVNMRLHSEGLESYYVEFDWEHGKYKGRHSVVVFQKADEWFIVDNEHSHPKKVKRASLIEMLKEWIPAGYTVISIANKVSLKDI
jgi:hypothetical protein